MLAMKFDSVANLNCVFFSFVILKIIILGVYLKNYWYAFELHPYQRNFMLIATSFVFMFPLDLEVNIICVNNAGESSWEY